MIGILDWAAQNQALTKECQNLFAGINEESTYSDVPETVNEYFNKCVREVALLRDDLFEHKDMYIGNGMNLTRKGRNRVRETWNAMRHFHI